MLSHHILTPLATESQLIELLSRELAFIFPINIHTKLYIYQIQGFLTNSMCLLSELQTFLKIVKH